MPSARKYSAIEAGHHWDPGEVLLATKEARLEGQRGSCRCMSWGAPWDLILVEWGGIRHGLREWCFVYFVKIILSHIRARWTFDTGSSSVSTVCSIFRAAVGAYVQNDSALAILTYSAFCKGMREVQALQDSHTAWLVLEPLVSRAILYTGFLQTCLSQHCK